MQKPIGKKPGGNVDTRDFKLAPQAAEAFCQEALLKLRPWGQWTLPKPELVEMRDKAIDYELILRIMVEASSCAKQAAPNADSYTFSSAFFARQWHFVEGPVPGNTIEEKVSEIRHIFGQRVQGRLSDSVLLVANVINGTETDEHIRSLCGTAAFRSADRRIDWRGVFHLIDRLAGIRAEILRGLARFITIDVAENQDQVKREKEQKKTQLGMPKRLPPAAPVGREKYPGKRKQASEMFLKGLNVKEIRRALSYPKPSPSTIYNWLAQDARCRARRR